MGVGRQLPPIRQWTTKSYELVRYDPADVAVLKLGHIMKSRCRKCSVCIVVERLSLVHGKGTVEDCDRECVDTEPCIVCIVCIVWYSVYSVYSVV